MNRKATLRYVIYVALFVFFTLLFITVNYPSEKLTDKVNDLIYVASNGTVTVGNVSLKPPFSMEMASITLVADQGRSVDMGVALVRPHLLRFLSGNKGANVRLKNPWLTSRLTFVSSGDGWSLDIRSIEVDLSKLPDEFMSLPLAMEGKVLISLDLLSNDPSQGISNGEASVTSGPVVISGDILKTLGFAPLKITRVSMFATVKDNVLTLGENAIDGDLEATARGVVRITPDNPMASRLDIAVELKPGPESRERLLPIFKLAGARPGADGSISFKVRGTVGRPAVTM